VLYWPTSIVPAAAGAAAAAGAVLTAAAYSNSIGLVLPKSSGGLYAWQQISSAALQNLTSIAADLRPKFPLSPSLLSGGFINF